MKSFAVLAALPILLPTATYAYPNPYHSTNILTPRGLPLPGHVAIDAVSIEAREANPYTETAIYPRALVNTPLPEREIADRHVYETLKRDPSALRLAHELLARVPNNLPKNKHDTHEAGGETKSRAGSVGHDLMLGVDVMSVLPLPGMEEVGLGIKGVSMADKGVKAVEYARKGVEAAKKVNDVVGKVQDAQSDVQTAQQVVGLAEQIKQGKKSGQGKQSGSGKARRRRARRALEPRVVARRGW